MMISVAFNPEDLIGDDAAWWEQWLAKARAATESALKEGETGNGVNFEVLVWTELKQWPLKNVFYGRCAYCETLTQVSGYGTADHHRPKKRVGLTASPRGVWARGR